ncbi:MAG TPA: nitroreductase family protein, partial [Tenuifilaceae bacterium]|nr:nitroreductase family protein [Tenuifilaceae bacterium]
SCMLIQAQSMGLITHVMGGFNRETLRDNLSIPDTQEIGAVIAIGLPGSIDELLEKLKERALSTRSRKTLDEVCRFV